MAFTRNQLIAIGMLAHNRAHDVDNAIVPSSAEAARVQFENERYAGDLRAVAAEADRMIETPDNARADGLSVPNIDDNPRDTVEEYARIFATLAAYASTKAIAMRCRERGSIASAVIHERSCERLYSELPADARW